MKKLFALLLLASTVKAGDLVNITTESATVNIPVTISDQGVQIFRAESVEASGLRYGRILLPNVPVSEKPNLANFTNPNTGLSLSSNDIIVIHNGTADFSFSRDTWDGGGVVLIHNATRQEPLGNALPVFSNELNKDGIFWIDNRLPDGVVGHDPSGRSLLFDVGRHYPLRVGYNGIDVTTMTVTAIQFRDGSIMTTVPTGGGSGGGGSGCQDDGALSSAPSTPGVCESYFNTVDHQKYMWNGSAWVILG